MENLLVTMQDQPVYKEYNEYIQKINLMMFDSQTYAQTPNDATGDTLRETTFLRENQEVCRFKSRSYQGEFFLKQNSSFLGKFCR